MIERLIFTALAQGIEDLKRDPGEIEDMFRRRGLAKTEYKKVRDLFLQLTPNVIHNYPREDSKFPLYAIILGEESESQQFIGDGGQPIDADLAEELGDAGAEGDWLRTSFYQHQYHIWVATESPVTTLYYYEIAKTLLTQQRDFFTERGLHQTQFSGSDLAPDDRYLPAFLFIRRLTFACSSAAPVVEERPGGRVRSVAGIHVDDGTSSEINGVVTHVTTPYHEEEP